MAVFGHPQVDRILDKLCVSRQTNYFRSPSGGSPVSVSVSFSVPVFGHPQVDRLLDKPCVNRQMNYFRSPSGGSPVSVSVSVSVSGGSLYFL